METRPPVKEELIDSAVGDIHVPQKNANSNITLDTNFEFVPQNPYTISSNNPDQGYGISSVNDAPKEKSGFWTGFGSEFYEWNTASKLGHAAYEKYISPSDTAPSDWKPNSQPEMFYGIRDQYQSYLMDARSPQDLEFRRNRVLGEQSHDDKLANGSTFSEILGGVAGAIIDPINLIPIVGWTKYAKLAPTFFKGMMRAFPGMAAYSVISSGANQLDKVEGNVTNFLIDAGVDTVFGSALFGLGGIAAVTLDKMEMWNLRKLTSAYLKGVDYKFSTDEKGVVNGIKAFDTTGNVNADEVSYAQDLANSSFYKGGLFKIPYIGDAIIKVKGAPIIGSPLVNMLNSSYKTVAGFADRVVDHGIITKNIAEGGTAPVTYAQRMKQEYASLRSIAAQMRALHLERNGYKFSNRTAGSVVEYTMDMYNKGLKTLNSEYEGKWTNLEDFYDEVQQVLHSEVPSENSAVNSAAQIAREHIDTTYKNWREAYGLPETWLPPKQAAGYLMRVYDTQYMNSNKGQWVKVVSDWLAESDATITSRMEPINTLRNSIKEATDAHLELSKKSKSDKSIKASSDRIEKMKRDLKVMESTLQNDLRNDPNLQLHVDDWHALSANEADELQKIKKPLADLQKKIDEQQKIVDELKRDAARSKQSAVKGKTAKTAKKHAANQASAANIAEIEDNKLVDLKNQYGDAEYELYLQIKNGEINPSLYDPYTLKLKDESNRLKFRDVYNNHLERENHAKAYYDTIMNQTPEDTIAQIMGRMTGNQAENHLKQRSINMPDQLLYDNKFMTKDLMAKLNNYSIYLARRTHLKNTFKDVTHNGGIEPLIEKLQIEYQNKREPIDSAITTKQTRLSEIDEMAKKGELSATVESERKALKSDIKQLGKLVDKETSQFNNAKNYMNNMYERMMGIRQRTKAEHITRSIITTFTAMANLHFLAATQIADLGSVGLQHGVWPFIRDGAYPIIQSLGGMLKTKDSEAFRKTAPSLHLGLQDVLNHGADKNFAMEAQPYANMGRIVSGLEKLAHFSANMDLTTHLDNGLQRLTGSVTQAEFMRILHDAANGTMSAKDSEYLRKYGIDPTIWAPRMVQAYKDAGGFKTALGGYQSNFWQWPDMEAANVFSDAVFKSIQNTIFTRGLGDSPFWADNMLGMIFHTFTGWGYASVNRLLIPTMQRPDAEKMLGVVFSMSMGSLVSPVRRMARGEDAVPDDMTDGQRFWETVNDSSVASSMANVLSWANLMSDDKLLGQLKNDKYHNRLRSGSAGVVFGTANRLANIIDAMASGEWNKQTQMDAAKMLPVFGSLAGYNMSRKFTESLDIPETRAQARALKGTS